MAEGLNINPLNVSALSALAGNRIGYLNLPVADESKYPAMYSEMLNRAQIAKLAAHTELQRQQMATQGALGVANLQADRAMSLQQNNQQFQAGQNAQDRALQEQKLQQQNDYNQAQLGMDYSKLGLQAQQLQQQGQYQQGELTNAANRNDIESKKADDLNAFHQELAQVREHQLELLSRSKLKEEDRQLRGAAGSMGLAFTQTHDPSTWGELLPPYVDRLHKEGILGDEEYKQLQGIDPKYWQDIFIKDISLNKMADDISKNPQLQNALNIAVKGQGGKNGPLTSAAESKAEQEAMSHINVAGQAQNLSDFIKNNPNAYTSMGNAAAEAGTISGRMPLLTPIINAVFSLAGQNPEEAEKAKQLADSKTTSMWGDIAKNLSPFLLRAANSDYKNKLLPNTSTDSPQQALIKSQAIDQLMEYKKTLDQQFMHNGVITNQREYDKAMQAGFNKAILATTSGNPSESSQSTEVSPPANAVGFNPETGDRNKLNMDYINKNIDKIMEMNPGMSKEDIMKQLGGK